MLARKISTVDKNFPIFSIVSSCACLKNKLLEWTSFLEDQQLLERVSAGKISQSLFLQIRNVESSFCKHLFLKAFNHPLFGVISVQKSFILERLK